MRDQRFRSFHWHPIGLLTIVFGACSSPINPEHGAERAWAVLGPAGGALSLDRGAGKGARIVIPSGALLSPVQITMRAASLPDGLSRTARAAGPYIEFGPDGL